jgi:hypothetical protein
MGEHLIGSGNCPRIFMNYSKVEAAKKNFRKRGTIFEIQKVRKKSGYKMNAASVQLRRIFITEDSQQSSKYPRASAFVRME